ncbi:hypothetical protein ACYZT4_17580 [Pseudomonas sp. GB2N2]
MGSSESVEKAVRVAVDFGAKALVFNCSQPEVIAAAFTEASDAIQGLNQSDELAEYANEFPPAGKEAKAISTVLEIRRDLGPDSYLRW